MFVVIIVVCRYLFGFLGGCFRLLFVCLRLFCLMLLNSVVITLRSYWCGFDIYLFCFSVTCFELFLFGCLVCWWRRRLLFDLILFRFCLLVCRLGGLDYDVLCLLFRIEVLGGVLCCFYFIISFGFLWLDWLIGLLSICFECFLWLVVLWWLL